MPRIQASDVCNILRSLDPSTATGYDNIPAKFLIKCSSELSKPLADLFNLSLSRGVYPDMLKWDNVVPIYKRKGSKNNIDCYRGITIQPIFAKIFEGFVNRALRQHIDSLIHDCQHGFLKSKSCATNLACYTDFISKSFDKKAQTHSIYTDFQKAFDVVPHKLLLLKLNRKFGVHDHMYSWFSSYLDNRHQRVVLNGQFSDWYSVTSGVPQGSKIGPTLFIMYINDIFECIHHSEILLFADDCKIFKEINTDIDCQQLQDDFNRLIEWCKIWKMKLHPDKCVFMNFTMKRSNDVMFDYSLGESSLNRVYEMKDLGVYFTPNLNFSLHVNKIVSKSFQMLGFVKRITKDFSDTNTLMMLYNSYIRSRLEYCSQIWNPSSTAKINKLERVQKKFLKHLSYKRRVMYKQLSYEELCCNFNVKSLQSRRNIADLSFLNKVVTNSINSPYLVSQIFLHVPNYYQTFTRTTRSIAPAFYVNNRINVRKDSFMPRVLNLANRLDLYDDIVMKTPAAFKRCITPMFL